ncbi:NADH:ubiquinone oxidoreductase [Candidatus Woesearchaeota archaeon]|nr:NADH:ubiquinone oxidoreductase [Candidatus Woesearchaeota archaeon]
MCMDTIIQHLPVLIIALPLLAAFLIPLIDKVSKTLRNIVAVLVVLLNAVMCFALRANVTRGMPATYVLGGEQTAIPLPSGSVLPIRILLTVDSFSILMAIACSLIALATIIYSLHFMRKSESMGNSARLGKYYALLMLVIASMNGMVLTGDLFNMFVFLEILSLSSSGLVTFWRKDEEAPEAAFKYLMISTIASLFVLFAIGMLYGQYGALNIAALSQMIQYSMLDKVALCMLLAGFAMKCGAVPMHMWVPDTYSRAPAAITALFVVISQVSLYALIRIVFTVYGLTLNLHAVGWTLIVLGMISMLVGVFMAIPQNDIKRLMAYQSVSQTGYMLLGIGVGLAVLSDPQALSSYGVDAINGGVFHIFNHALYKALLFMTAGAIFYAIGTRNMNEMTGLAKKMPMTTILFIIGALAIAGIPPFNGFASKFIIYESVYRFSPILSIIALIVSVLTLAIFIKAFYAAFLRPTRKDMSAVREVPVFMMASMIFIAVLVIIIGLFPGFFVENFIQPATSALINQAGYTGVVLP